MKKILTFIKRRWALLLLATIAFALGIILALRPAKTPPSTAIPTPTLTPSTVQTGAGLGDPQLYQDIYNQDVKDYPLLVKTPVETANYTVFYSAPFTLTVKMKPTATKTQSQIRPEVISWIKEQGGDPKAHSIVFK